MYRKIFTKPRLSFRKIGAQINGFSSDFDGFSSDFYRFRISPDFQIANTTPQQRNSSERVIEQNTKPSVWHVTAQLWGISTVEKGSRFRLGSANRSESKCGITRAEWLLFNLFYSPCASSFGHPDPSTRGELPPRRSWRQDRSLSEPPPRWIWR